jgi:DNA-binding transcriptional LysR family regulator
MISIMLDDALIPNAPSLAALRLFVAIVEEHSFTGAARRENATQSGVSQQLRRLEDRFGVRLIVRERGAVRATPAGERLYRRAVALLRGAAELDREVRGFAAGIEGEAAVGLMSALTRCALGPALRRFMTAHPNASVRVVEAISGRLVEQVAAEALEVAVVPAVEPLDAILATPMRSVPEMYVCRPASGAVSGGGGRPDPAHMTPVDLRLIRPLRLVLPAAGNLRRTRMLAHLATLGVAIERVLELDSMFAVFEFVAESDFAAIVPSIMVVPEIISGALCVRPLLGPPMSLDLTVIQPRRRPLSATAAAFLELLEAEIDAAAASWTR